MWMNVEAFNFIVIFYVASLASTQKWKKEKKKKNHISTGLPSATGQKLAMPIGQRQAEQINSLEYQMIWFYFYFKQMKENSLQRKTNNAPPRPLGQGCKQDTGQTRSSGLEHRPCN
jgi:hypothetical protein